VSDLFVGMAVGWQALMRSFDSLLKRCLKHSLVSITANFEPSREGPEHDDMEDEVRFSLLPPSRNADQPSFD
jgi:hypothetical protein